MDNYPLLANQLPAKIKNVWRNYLFLNSLGFIVFGGIATLFIKSTNGLEGFWFIAVVLYFAAVLLQFIVRMALIPYRYAFHRYQITPEEIEFQTGYFFRSTTYVPIVRIQHVETEQGPLLRHEGLMSLVIHTAATAHHIDGLEMKEAQQLRDQIIQLVKVVKEDV